MRTIFLFVLFALTANLWVMSQSGSTCNTAIQNYSKDSCAYQNWVITGTEMWFNFKANTPYVYISVITTKFGINAPHVHRVELIDGTCSNPVVIADDELPFVDYWDELRIDLDASGLIPGNKYYIRLSRQPSGGKLCDKSTCRAMIQPAGFNICIQDVEVFIPPDSSLEQPSNAYQYIQNKGQVIDVNGNPRPDIVMVAPNASPATYVANNAAYFVFAKIDTSILTIDTLHRVDMALVGANPNTRTFKTEQTPGRTNYFLAHTPKGVSAKGFSRLVWNNVYPKIDMQFYSNGAGIKEYFVVRQGGDAQNIKMKFNGATQLNITNNGGLEIVTSVGKMQFDPGHAYQINPAGNIVGMPWQAKFIKVSANEVVLDIRKYAKNMPLIIQVDRGHIIPPPPPQGNLIMSTYFGGNSGDVFTDVKIGSAGDVYCTGYSGSFPFPGVSGVSAQPNIGGASDAVVVKFSPNGKLRWATYYGGTSFDRSFSIGIDKTNNENIFICGYTYSPDLTVKYSPIPFSYLDSINTQTDIFIAEFDSTGEFLIWATYYGGEYTQSDNSWDLTLDMLGNIYIVGSTGPVQFANFPLFIQAGAYNDSLGDGVIIKFTTGGKLLWATRIIGSSYIKSTDVDGNNNLFITGVGGANYPVINTNNYHNGSKDIVITKFDLSNQIDWSGCWGGINEDDNPVILADKFQNTLFITGTTLSNDTLFPITYPGGAAFIDSTYNSASGGDAFILEINSTTGATVWCTYLGSLYPDIGTSLTIDTRGYLYVFGYTEGGLSTPFYDFPFPASQPSNTYFSKYFSGQSDAFIAAFTNNRQYVWGTLLGGSGFDRGYSIASYKDLKLFVVGETESNDFLPLESGGGIPYFDASLSGTSDAFISGFSLTPVVIGINNYTNLSASFYIFPNPVSDFLTLCFGSYETPFNIHVSIENLLGQTVIMTGDKKPDNQYILIPVGFLQPGIYIIKVDVGNYPVFFQKFIVLNK